MLTRTSSFHLQVVALAIASTCAPAMLAHAATPVEQLLDTGWKGTPESYAAAQQQYEQAKAAAANDPRASYAIALVALKNRKTDDAQKYLAQATTTASSNLNATDLAARRMKIYLDLFRKDAPGAQAGIHALAQLLAADDSISPKPESRQAAEWLGSVLGFLAGPAAQQNFPLKADVVQTDIMGQLKGQLAIAVNDGKSAALKQYDSLKQQQSAARDEAKKRLASKRDDEIKQVETQRSTVQDKLKKLEDPAAKDSSTASAGGKKGGKDSKPDAKNPEEQQKKAMEMQQQFVMLQRQIQQERRKPRPNEQAIMQMNTRLVMLQQQASELGFTPDQMQAQHSEDQKKQSAEAERTRLQEQEKKLAARLKQLQTASDTTAPPTQLDSKLSDLRSYAPIDLEQEKERVLASYK